MNRNSLLEMSGRAMHQAVRFTLNQGNDNPMMQEMHFDGMFGDGRDKVERMQNYGFSSTPLPRDEQQGGSQSGGGDAGDTIKGLAAEGICMFMGGQRNHPVCIGVDDRRHRPMGLAPGENAQYDDIGQMTLLRRTMTAMLSLDSKDEKTGKMVERFVSLRHVNKEKQERPKQKSQGSGSGGSNGGGTVATLGPQQQAVAAPAARAPDRSKYKHEGDSVNTEIRCTKSRIEFRAGDTVVGYYDAGSQTWYLTGKIVSIKATTRTETIGPTYLGLDQQNEVAPKDATVSGPAKQTYAKV